MVRTLKYSDSLSQIPVELISKDLHDLFIAKKIRENHVCNTAKIGWVFGVRGGGSGSGSIIDPDQVFFEQTRRFGYWNRLIIDQLLLFCYCFFYTFFLFWNFFYTFWSRTKLISRWFSLTTSPPHTAFPRVLFICVCAWDFVV